ncbi:MAG: DUF447 family protein, partial [Acidilobaceae archaeon]
MEGLKEGVYYELLCRLCEAGVITPLGLRLSGGSAYFRVFSDRLREAMKRTRKLVCLAPSDPLLFYEVVIEKKEPFSCEKEFDLTKGHWLICESEVVIEAEFFDLYKCKSFNAVWGFLEPYSRAYGCLVELLILFTKAKASVLEKEAIEYAKWLNWCVERSSSVESHVHAARRLLELIEKALG